MNKDNIVGLSIGLFLGAIIGGTVALLYAPQSGKETRKQIKDKTEELIEQVKSLPADLRAKFNKATVDDIKKR